MRSARRRPVPSRATEEAPLIRHHYVVRLSRRADDHPASPPGAAIATASVDDHEALARLMLDAYLGTIDYEGETIVEAREEIRRFFDGEPLLDATFTLHIEDVLASAILVTRWEGVALVAAAMTRPEYTGRGLASGLVDRTLQALAAAGEPTAHAFITEGNGSSETVFLRAGFERQPKREGNTGELPPAV